MNLKGVWLLVLGLAAAAWLAWGDRIKLPEIVSPEPPPVVVVVPTAATYIYEKDNGSVPPPVLSALDKLNRKGIAATSFEEDTTDADGQVPDQYKAALPAAREAGLPSLVVTAADKVLRVVKSPTTEEQVLEAAQ